MTTQINPIQYKKQILKEFQNSSHDVQIMLTFQQLVFILDQKSRNNKCDRSVAKQLFNQSKDINNTSSIQRIVQKYIENLQTSKLCLQRQQIKYNKLKADIQSCIKQTSHPVSYVFLTLFQATIHSHFSKIPIFSYKISPSDIQQTTIINQLNPIMNHSYTLQLQDGKFEIIFYESSVEIGRWRFNGQQKQSGKQQKYTIKHEGLEVSLKVKYFDKRKSTEKQLQNLKTQLQEVQNKRISSKNAYQKLVAFEPFYLNQPILPIQQQQYIQEDKPNQIKQQQNQKNAFFNCTTFLGNKIPFLKKHVRNYYYMLIALLIIESFSSIYSPIPIVNIILWFYTLGLIFKKSNTEIAVRFWVIFFLQILIIINNIFSIFLHVKPNLHEKYTGIFIFDSVFELICLFFFWIMIIRRRQFDSQIEELAIQ